MSDVERMYQSSAPKEKTINVAVKLLYECDNKVTIVAQMYANLYGGFIG